VYRYLLAIFALLFVSYVSAVGQDPTRPLISTGVASSNNVKDDTEKLVLQSIINASDKENIKAIISGKLVATGDMIRQYKVISIEGKTVTLQASEHAKKLVLFSAPIVKYK